MILDLVLSLVISGRPVARPDGLVLTPAGWVRPRARTARGDDGFRRWPAGPAESGAGVGEPLPSERNVVGAGWFRRHARRTRR